LTAARIGTLYDFSPAFRLGQFLLAGFSHVHLPVHVAAEASWRRFWTSAAQHLGSEIGRNIRGIYSAGRVGTGFSDDFLETFHRTLVQIKRKTSPFVDHGVAEEDVTWVEPLPRFPGLRDDKEAKDREIKTAGLKFTRASKPVLVKKAVVLCWWQVWSTLTI